MASFTSLAVGVAAWSRSHTTPVTYTPATLPTIHGQSSFSRSANALWMKLNDSDAVPDFDPDQPQPPHDPHHNFQGNLELASRLLPAWQGQAQSESGDAPLFEQLTLKKDFKHTLTLSRQLAQTPHSVWGDHDALDILRLVGRDCVIDAYDMGNLSALQLCVVAYTFLKADHLVRDRLGDAIATDLPAIERFRAIKKIPIDPANVHAPLVFIQESPAGFPELKVQTGHPDLQASLIVEQLVRSYQKTAMMASCGIHEIAQLLNEPLDQTHLEMYYTLTDASAHALLKNIHALPQPQYLMADWSNCQNAYEQCCRFFGEDYMQSIVFGNAQGPNELSLARHNLAFIAPILKDFLTGREVDWS
ncbi:MAG: hypothetical protein R3194_03960 [Limnobacter sp.]|nr:hypothetical protein [Limnobacter sp.]